tara:strand:+ start:1276 stop:1788 length:513 start_codon:yes stop_codon:yes gene_type:complete
VIKQDTSENQANSIYLAIGSNLGNKRGNIENAKYELIKRNIRILKSSSYYQSLSWPNQNNPKFLNIVIKVNTNFSPIQLLEKCKEIEVLLGRKKTPKNSPRKCDIDIIDFNKKVHNDKIILPHPRMQRRNFVLLPLFEIDKSWVHPQLKQHIKTLIFSLSNKDITTIKLV